MILGYIWGVALSVFLGAMLWFIGADGRAIEPLKLMLAASIVMFTCFFVEWVQAPRDRRKRRDDDG